jgi:hypothetical protein
MKSTEAIKEEKLEKEEEKGKGKKKKGKDKVTPFYKIKLNNQSTKKYT